MKKRAVMIALLLTMTIAAAGCTKKSEETTKAEVSDTTEPVSYTHLTLPTICSV